MKNIVHTISLACGLLCAPLLNAQGIFSTSELYKSPRSLAMGGITTASGPNAFSVYENASATAYSDRKAEAGIMYSPWAKNATSNMERNNLLINAAAYYSLDTTNKLLLGVAYFAPGGNDLYPTDNEGNITGDKLKPKFLSVHAGYARRLSSAWGVSAILNYANWNPGINGSANAIGIDLGANYRLQLNPAASYLDIALKAAGWGGVIADEGDYKLPGIVAASVMWNRPFAPKHRVNLGGEIDYRCLDEHAFKASAGAEYSYNDFLFVRCGYAYTDQYSELNSYATIGAGVRVLSRVQADFSYLLANNDSPYKNTYAIGISILF